MEILHRGFDALDLAIQARIPSRLANELDIIKREVADSGSPAVLIRGDVWFKVHGQGKRGGYQFVGETDGELGALWAFKRPNRNDPWGVHVSFRALPLAIHGIGWARDYINKVLDALEVERAPNGESIGRVDYAVDVLAPDFVLDPSHFVMHARCGIRSHDEITSISTSGHSSRTTSVTIGKNPGRQVIVYDKRADTIDKRKVAWFKIWEAAREAQGDPPLDFTDPRSSRVWRVEARAFKRHLKDTWRITCWGDLQEMCSAVFGTMIEDIRHCKPPADRNRSRWPTSPLWDTVAGALKDDLFGTMTSVDRTMVNDAIRAEKRRQLVAQRHGLSVSLAALQGVSADAFRDFLEEQCREEFILSREHRVALTKRLAEASMKYTYGDG
ncbi:hypothetical protein DXV76_00690 [Rhodobacteraceae bacterium CCMM004]|nr:hypothetical protein DXV76_00690 [Rhodobacteraceae bacterium CCMM004]